MERSLIDQRLLLEHTSQMPPPSATMGNSNTGVHSVPVTAKNICSSRCCLEPCHFWSVSISHQNSPLSTLRAHRDGSEGAAVSPSAYRCMYEGIGWRELTHFCPPVLKKLSESPNNFLPIITKEVWDWVESTVGGKCSVHWWQRPGENKVTKASGTRTRAWILLNMWVDICLLIPSTHPSFMIDSSDQHRKYGRHSNKIYTFLPVVLHSSVN